MGSAKRNVGSKNRHNLVLVEKTKRRSSNHPFALVWIVRCQHGEQFGVNSCDFHNRKCPHSGGAEAAD